jgi:hypothetical protein
MMKVERLDSVEKYLSGKTDSFRKITHYIARRMERGGFSKYVNQEKVGYVLIRRAVRLLELDGDEFDVDSLKIYFKRYKLDGVDTTIDTGCIASLLGLNKEKVGGRRKSGF